MESDFTAAPQSFSAAEKMECSGEGTFRDELLASSIHYIDCYFHYQYVIDHLGCVVSFEIPSKWNYSTSKQRLGK